MKTFSWDDVSAEVADQNADWLIVVKRATESAIINVEEAGSANSGHRGHRGIPGYRGGSLPAANTSLGWALPKDETLLKHPEWMTGIIKAFEMDAEDGADLSALKNAKTVDEFKAAFDETMKNAKPKGASSTVQDETGMDKVLYAKAFTTKELSTDVGQKRLAVAIQEVTALANAPYTPPIKFDEVFSARAMMIQDAKRALEDLAKKGNPDAADINRVLLTGQNLAQTILADQVRPHFAAAQKEFEQNNAVSANKNYHPANHGPDHQWSEDAYQKAASTFKSENGGSIGQFINREQGFDGKPLVVSPREFDRMVKQENALVLWRGVANSAQTAQFRTGEYFAGKGFAGNGTYTATDLIDATAYSGRNGLIRMALRPGARVISSRDAKNLLSKANNGKFEPDKQFNMRDVGEYAASLGYDVIQRSNRGTWDDHVIILNRTAVFVDSEDYGKVW